MIQTLDRSQARLSAIRALDALVSAHLRWLNYVNRALICGTGLDTAGAPPANDGAWYRTLDAEPGQPWSRHLKQIAATHRRMHAAADRLGREHAVRPCIAAYDEFCRSAHHYKTVIRSLQFKLINDICLVDHLTGVWNRSSMSRKISAEYDRMIRHGDSCCLCMMDVDHFKAVNDRHGHAAGDQVLRAIIGVASKRLRRYDSLFRYGGEEFLFCLPKISAERAVAAMERVRADIACAPLYLPDGGEVPVTASFGVVAMTLETSVEENIKKADRALFLAKAAGRNRVCAWEE